MIRHVPTRLDLLRLATSEHGSGVTLAEVGVMNGDFSAEILTLPNIDRLYLIDPWQHQPGEYGRDPANVDQGGQDERYRNVCARFIADPRVTIMRATSIDVSQNPHSPFRIPHSALDFAYLDAAHDYQSVMADLIAWSEIAPVLFVHDFIQNEAGDIMGFAVVRAVHDFCAAHGWHVTALTTADEWPTCELRQITVTG